MQKTRDNLEAKEEYFIYNGALLLEKQISSCQGKGKGPQEQSTTFSIQEIRKATNNLDDRLIIGRKMATVYKGTLDGRTVGIKIFPGLYQNVDIERAINFFLNQASFKIQINHKNAVKLYGCCLETRVPILVHEFVSKGTLYDHLHGTIHGGSCLIFWRDRVRIASEISQVLSYMHMAKVAPIVHRNVKSANIFLDELYSAKLSNFGSSVFLPLGEPYICLPAVGTVGYIDPEYERSGRVTEKCDVYSFGVFLVELLTDMDPKISSFNFIDNFASCLAKNDYSHIIHPRLLEEGNGGEIQAFGELALKCVIMKGDDRPTMKEVALELRRILHIIKSRQAI